MRTLRRILAALAVVCMFVPCISMVSHAASGELRFTDPSTTVGAEVEVTAKFTAPVLIDTVEATLTYDSSMLKFISGDSATGGDGTVTISGDGGSSTEASFNLTFQALKEGTANIQVSQSSGVDAVGDALDLTNGSSAVSIGPGDPSLIEEEEGETGAETTTSGGQVEVDGVQYTITGGFSDALIPAGFVKGEKQFEGANCEVVTQEASGRSAFYLTPPLDSMDEQIIYINPSSDYDDLALFATLAHEGWPGHLYQTLYENSMNFDPVRSIFYFGGYTEGWAVYAERYAYRFTSLDEDTASLLAANSFLLLGFYARSDIGIHYDGWKPADLAEFLGGFGIRSQTALDTIYQAIVQNPGNYLKYYLGAAEILALKAEAEKVFGEQFDIRDFHRFILSVGPAPLSVVREYLYGWTGTD